MTTTTETAAVGAGDHPSLAAALAGFMADIPTVVKGKTATIPGRDGRSGYKYAYADLADVAAAAYPVLARHGLSFVAQPRHVEGLGLMLVGVLRHASGDFDEGMLPITGRDAQAIGSSLTYGRRYLLGCMTGIVTDEDDDGTIAAQAGTGRPQTEQQRQQGTSVRQQGPQTPTAAPAPAGPVDAAVLKAQTIAACKATDLAGLKAAWDEACRSGAVHATIVDPDDEQSTEPTVTLGAFITRRREQMQSAAA
jgi:hypothetical protein